MDDSMRDCRVWERIRETCWETAQLFRGKQWDLKDHIRDRSILW